MSGELIMEIVAIVVIMLLCILVLLAIAEASSKTNDVSNLGVAVCVLVSFVISANLIALYLDPAGYASFFIK